MLRLGLICFAILQARVLRTANANVNALSSTARSIRDNENAREAICGGLSDSGNADRDAPEV